MICSGRNLKHLLNTLNCAYFIEKTSKTNLKQTLSLDKYTIYMRTTAHGKPLSCLVISLHRRSIVAKSQYILDNRQKCFWI